MTIKHYITLFLLFCSTGLRAQSFIATVAKAQVATGEPFEVTFTLNANGEKFTPPNFTGFQVVGGPNESTSMTSINGAVSQSLGISYELIAERVGEFIIGSASIVINGKLYTTTPIKIKVVKGIPVPQNSSAQQSQQDASVAPRPSGDISKALFIKAVVDKSHVYMGEQITLVYKLYTQVGIEANDMDKAPDLNGFWSQDIKTTGQSIPWKPEFYKGQRFNVAEIKKTILFPEHAGDLTIDPLSMIFIAQQPIAPRNVMEQMFGGGYQQIKVKVASTPVVIHVKPLPEEGKPAGFTGAVGAFSVSAELDKKELKANETLNYKLMINGSGNIKLLKDAVITPPSDFDKYDPKITDSVDVNELGVTGTRTLNYLLIPRHEGNYTLDPVQFTYFNPHSGKYVTLTTRGFNVRVNKGTDAAGNFTTLAPADQRDVKLLSKDIKYIKTGTPDLYKDGEGFYGSAGYYSLLLLGPLLFIAAFAYRRYNEVQNADQVKLKSRRANKIAAKHMANAQVQLQQGNTQAFYEAVSKGLYGYLSDKLNIPAANLDRENIATELKSRSVNDVVIDKLVGTLDLCEMARFAPVSGVAQSDVFERSKSIINDIETNI